MSIANNLGSNEHISFFIQKKKVGITLHKATFDGIANHRDTAAKMITDVLLKAPNLQLLVVVLEGKKETEQIYGSFFMFILQYDQFNRAFSKTSQFFILDQKKKLNKNINT